MTAEPTVLQGALVDGVPSDVALADGRVSGVTAATDGGRPGLAADGAAVPVPGSSVVDLRGFVLLTAPAEPHAHLDKALSGESLPVEGRDLDASVRTWAAYSRTLDPADVRSRARRALTELVGHGATAVRTHVNATAGDDPLLALHAVLAVRDDTAGTVTVEVVFLPGHQVTDDVIRAALAEGADLLGGAPHSAPDPVAETRRLLRLAQVAGVDVDLHTDEQLRPEVRTLGVLAAEISAGRFIGRATASHCVSLGLQDGADLDALVAAVTAARIGVVACPLTNLGLQGRNLPGSPPRGLTAIRALLAGGATVAAGGDNIRDPFNPVGRADPLEVAALLVNAAHLDVATAYELISAGARAVLGLPAAGPRAGAVADLLAVRATSLTDAVARAPEDRVVIRAGHLVARSSVSRTGDLYGEDPAGVMPRVRTASRRA